MEPTFPSALPPLFCTFALMAPGFAQEQPNQAVGLAREALSRFADTQRAISNEKQNWREAKETLETRLEVLKREVDAYTKRVEEAKAGIADAEAKRAELLEENERSKATSASLEQRIGDLEQRVLSMLPRLPEPLRERVRALSQRLPKTPPDAAETSMSLNDRYANVIGILNEVGKWNRAITIASEVRQLTDGSSVEVAVLYVGLGQAYYTGGGTGNAGKVAGIGTATAQGWTWKPADELADAVRAAIAVYKDEQLATLVRLPVQIL